MQVSIDIGGTKIAYGIIELVRGTPTLKYYNQVNMIRGLEGLKECITSIIRNCEEWASLHLSILNKTVFVCSAGNLSGKNGSVILPGTAVHLGTSPTEFDHCDLIKLCRDASNNLYEFIVKNDGVAQLAGGIRLLSQNKAFNSDLLGQKVAYIGPGTGLGGAFAEIGFDAHLDFYTDGHIFDIELKNRRGEKVMAEDVYSGTGFYKRYQVSTKSLNKSPHLFNKFKSAIEELGYYHAQLCLLIYKGSFNKLSPYPWSESDYSQVKGTTRFVIGGSIGVSGDLSDTILSTAAQFIKKQGLEFKFYKIPDPIKAALIGAYHFL